MSVVFTDAETAVDKIEFQFCADVLLNTLGSLYTLRNVEDKTRLFFGSYDS